MPAVKGYWRVKYRTVKGEHVELHPLGDIGVSGEGDSTKPGKISTRLIRETSVDFGALVRRGFMRLVKR